MEPIKDFKTLAERARQKGPVWIAVVAPYDLETMLAVKEGLLSGLARPHLFGDAKRIEPLIDESGINRDEIRIYDEADVPKMLDAAVESIRTGQNVLLMKGSISTPVILKTVLDKTKGLNIGRLCSHVVVCEIPDFDRMLVISDGGLNVAPTLLEKVDIVKNAIQVAHALNVEIPKVAILAAIEEVNPSIPATTDAASLSKMAERGEIRGAIVDGPLALDNAISMRSAEKKGIKSEVAGRADVIIVPTIEVGNALGKSLSYFAKSSNAGIVVGAKVPIVLPSRSGKTEAKWGSLALGVLLIS